VVKTVPLIGEIAMPNNTSLLGSQTLDRGYSSHAPEVVRSLAGLIDRLKTHARPESISSDSSEEVLVDTEVDGRRYLLIRMPKPDGAGVRLSPREQEIVRMVAKGHPNKVIADVLNISSWTVCTHLRRIFAKLNVASRAAMVARISEIHALNPKDQRSTSYCR
jgi:DNA-binding NarL/FixJ family response regulator